MLIPFLECTIDNVDLLEVKNAVRDAKRAREELKHIHEKEAFSQKMIDVKKQREKMEAANHRVKLMEDALKATEDLYKDKRF